MFDGEAFGKQMTEVVKSYVDRATAPLIEQNEALSARIAEMEKRAPVPGETGPQGEKGEPGEAADIEALRAELAEMVKAAVADLPPAERGEKGDPGEIGPQGETGERGSDGVGIADLIIDRDHNLVATFEDGRVKSLGNVVGRDGENGKDGADGKAGETFTLDDFDIEPIDDRTLKFKFERGGVMHSFEMAFPVAIYRGVWTEAEYERGDMVTWAGSVWHADKATSAKPDTPDGGWKLAVKRGRDGKDKV